MRNRKRRDRWRRGLLGRYTPYKIAGGNVSSLNSAQTCRNLRKSRRHAVSYFSTETVENNKHHMAQKLLNSERFFSDERSTFTAALTPFSVQHINKPSGEKNKLPFSPVFTATWMNLLGV